MQNQKTSPILSVILIGVLLLFTAACTPANNVAQITGKWTPDTDAMIKQMKADLPEKESEAMVTMFSEMLKLMVFEFDYENTSLKISMMGETEEIDFTIKSETANSIEISSPDQTGTLTIEVLGPNQLKLVNNDPNSSEPDFILNRKKD